MESANYVKKIQNSELNDLILKILNLRLRKTPYGVLKMIKKWVHFKGLYLMKEVPNIFVKDEICHKIEPSLKFFKCL